MKRGEKKAELEALIIQLLNDADEVSIRSVADAAGVPNDETERKAIRRALKSLTSQNLIDPKGSARSRVYILREKKPEADVLLESDERVGMAGSQISHFLKGIDVSPESKGLWNYVTKALAERSPVGYVDEFLCSYEPNETYNGTQTWRQDFSFDRYGNRNFVESNTSFAGFDKLCNSNTELCATLRKQLNPGINSGNNNRMNSGQDYSYDSAGNTLTDANGQTFVYDGENKQVEVRNSSNAAIGKYWYDGDGKRVKKEVPGTGEVTIFVYDAAGKQIAEYSTVVVSANDAKVAYLTADHLGSPRINTDVTGAVTSRHDYHPFGEEMATTQRTSGLGYADDTVRKQFTGYERDGETDLDFAQARMFGSGLGRFTSPDPILSSASLGEPQSWNRYSYVLNNPLVFTDPTGMFIWTKALGGDVEDDDLTQHFTDEANKITDLKKRNKALKKIHKKVINIINRRNQIRAGIEAAKGLLTSDKLSESQKSEISRSINIYGKEGDDNNVIVGQTPDRNGRTMFGEDGRIIVTFGVGNNAQEIAIQFVHEGSHVADDVAFNNGVAGSDISRFATEKGPGQFLLTLQKDLAFRGIRHRYQKI
ncbi:MAG: RHS repeat-associated core domain-containing protein [Chloracidobacterium sp.]|nr:RHS repeat-associated core domain-containing protein [Chloracidobacterium sp.]